MNSLNEASLNEPVEISERKEGLPVGIEPTTLQFSEWPAGTLTAVLIVKKDFYFTY